MDDPGRLRGGSADQDGPGARLLWARGQVGLQAHRREADPGELIEPRLVLADAGQQIRGRQLLVACSVTSGPMVCAFARSGTTASSAAATSGRSTSNQSTVGEGSISVDRAHADAAPALPALDSHPSAEAQVSPMRDPLGPASPDVRSPRR
jgi:hypothetical protein